MPRPTSIEICAGAGGQALGLEEAGFVHLAIVELDSHACETLRRNRPRWKTIEDDVTQWSAKRYRGTVSLLAGGVPCPPFSKAGQRLGRADERDLFPDALRLVRECAPRVVMIENVRGLMDSRFDAYRNGVEAELNAMEPSYTCHWKILNASDFGVPQLRPRTVLVALQTDVNEHFKWPTPRKHAPPTVGETLYPYMASRGWGGAAEWRDRATKVAPTIVGGSTKHGGPDLGPTRAKAEWSKLGVNAHKLADATPEPDFEGMPCLTVDMAAALQGFPPDWVIAGKKTNAYRQIGNAFPPPVAEAVGRQIAKALLKAADSAERAEGTRAEAAATGSERAA